MSGRSVSDVALAEIGESRGSIGELGASQTPGAGARHEIGKSCHEGVEVELVDIVKGRCNQAATTECGGNAKMNALGGPENFVDIVAIELRRILQARAPPPLSAEPHREGARRRGA